jgi:hypothetical protein
MVIRMSNNNNTSDKCASPLKKIKENNSAGRVTRIIDETGDMGYNYAIYSVGWLSLALGDAVRFSAAGNDTVVYTSA